MDIYAVGLGTVSGNNGAHRATTIAAGITIGFGSSLEGLGVPAGSVLH